MKKSFLVVIVMVTFAFTNAQNNGQTAMGKWLIEANNGFGPAHPANTSIQFSSSDGVTSWNVGVEAGYFVMDDLAAKFGLGYGGFDADLFNSSVLSYKIGAKYYIISTIPIQVDYSGASVKDANENPSYIGFQGGYAWFLGDNVSIEPGVRYNLSLNNDFFENVLQVNIGFVLHF